MPGDLGQIVRKIANARPRYEAERCELPHGEEVLARLVAPRGRSEVAFDRLVRVLVVPPACDVRLDQPSGHYWEILELQRPELDRCVRHLVATHGTHSPTAVASSSSEPTWRSGVTVSAGAGVACRAPAR